MKPRELNFFLKYFCLGYDKSDVDWIFKSIKTMFVLINIINWRRKEKKEYWIKGMGSNTRKIKIRKY